MLRHSTENKLHYKQARIPHKASGVPQAQFWVLEGLGKIQADKISSGKCIFMFFNWIHGRNQILRIVVTLD